MACQGRGTTIMLSLSLSFSLSLSLSLSLRLLLLVRYRRNNEISGVNNLMSIDLHSFFHGLDRPGKKQKTIFPNQDKSIVR